MFSCPSYSEISGFRISAYFVLSTHRSLNLFGAVYDDLDADDSEEDDDDGEAIVGGITIIMSSSSLRLLRMTTKINVNELMCVNNFLFFQSIKGNFERLPFFVLV